MKTGWPARSSVFFRIDAVTYHTNNFLSQT